MIRRSSISYLGLFSTQFKIIDMEYSIRVSSLLANICFCTGYGFINVVNPDSNSRKFYDVIRAEQKMLSKIYPSIDDNFKLNDIFLRLKDKLKSFKSKPDETIVTDKMKIYREIIKKGQSELKGLNKKTHPKFMMNS
jgi:hypothetical protein